MRLSKHERIVNSTNVTRYIFLSMIFGIITTALYYSGYGVSDHIEQIPIILRSMSGDYLLNDFFTNASSESIARLGYSQFLAILAGSEQNLPAVFLIFTAASNIAISVISFAFTNNLFESAKAGIWAAALVMSISTFSLGKAPQIYRTSMVPSTMAIPFILWSIHLLLQGKIMKSILLSGISSLFHPLFGLEISGLLLGAYIITRLVKNERLTTKTTFALLVFVFFSTLLLVPQVLQQNMDSEQFIYIVAYFRHPHHYLPSTFGSDSYLNAAAFLFVVLILFFRWFKSSQNQNKLIPSILLISILILCLGGYIFVELIPNRIWVTAQTFRLLYVVKWLGVIFIAGEIARSESTPQLLYASSVLNPISLGVVVLYKSLRERFNNLNFQTLLEILNAAPIGLLIIFLLVRFHVSLLSIACLGLYVFLISIFDVFTNRESIAASAVIIFGVGLFAFYPKQLPYLERIDLINRTRQNLSFEMKSGIGVDGISVAEFARDNTPENSVFLTPPNFGQFRLLANRAIVVDFKAFPFSDEGITIWYERITACYGLPSSNGFSMVEELKKNYLAIDDIKLIALQNKYHYDYAILFSDTSTNFDVIYQNSTYKVVRVMNQE